MNETPSLSPLGTRELNFELESEEQPHQITLGIDLLRTSPTTHATPGSRLTGDHPPCPLTSGMVHWGPVEYDKRSSIQIVIRYPAFAGTHK